MIQDFNRSSSHPDMATNRSVSDGDQSSNTSSGGWERASSSSPCKGLSWVICDLVGDTIRRSQRLGHGTVFMYFFTVVYTPVYSTVFTYLLSGS